MGEADGKASAWQRQRQQAGESAMNIVVVVLAGVAVTAQGGFPHNRWGDRITPRKPCPYALGLRSSHGAGSGMLNASRLVFR